MTSLSSIVRAKKGLWECHCDSFWIWRHGVIEQGSSRFFFGYFFGGGGRGYTMGFNHDVFWYLYHNVAVYHKDVEEK